MPLRRTQVKESKLKWINKLRPFDKVKVYQTSLLKVIKSKIELWKITKIGFLQRKSRLSHILWLSSHNYEICLRISCNTNLIKIRFYLNRFADIFESQTEIWSPSAFRILWAFLIELSFVLVFAINNLKHCEVKTFRTIYKYECFILHVFGPKRYEQDMCYYQLLMVTPCYKTLTLSTAYFWIY